jgi:protein ImuB
MLPGARFRWRTVIHGVRHLEGPERIAMEWWRAPGATRDYFRMEDEEGRRFWLYREEGARWFLQGLFA